MSGIVTRHDERRTVQPEQILRLRARSGIPVEERACHAGDELDIAFDVLPRVRRSELRIVSQDGHPRSAARILSKRLRAALRQHHHLLEAMLFDVRQMLGESRVAVDSILRAADRPPQHEAPRRLRVRNTKRDRGRAPHAAAQDVRAVDAEMLEQSISLLHVMRPRDPLDPAAGLTRFTSIEDDAHVRSRQVIEHLDPRVHAERCPLVQRRVETARREHEQGHAGPSHFVSCRDAVDDRGRQPRLTSLRCLGP